MVYKQDEDRAKAEGPSSEELERLERLKAELLSANSSQTSGSPVGSISSSSIGCTSGGTRKKGQSPRGSKERRRSAGDEQGMMSQLNMLVRTRTDSGKQLSDLVRSVFSNTVQSSLMTCISSVSHRWSYKCCYILYFALLHYAMCSYILLLVSR